MTEFTVPLLPEPGDAAWSAVDRYLSGTATPADHHQVETWCAGSTARRAALDAWREAWQHLSPETKSSRAALQQRADAILVSSDASRVTTHGRARTAGQGRWMRWALGGVAAIAIGVGTLMRPAAPATDTIAHIYRTNDTQRAALTLDDGTGVILAPATEMRLVRFGAAARTIEFTRGQAYFDVSSTRRTPFVIHSGPTAIRVLGTGFLVQKIPGGHVRVAVATGKIRVTATPTDSGVTLAAGQVADVVDSSVHVNTVGDVATDAEWLQGRLVFRDAPIPMVLATLSRWYGYQFRYADSALAHKNVTIGVSVKSSAEALAAVEQILDVHLAITGDTVTLIPHKAASKRNPPHTRDYDVWNSTREVGR